MIMHQRNLSEQLQSHSLTGQRVSVVNQSIRCSKCPPCLHFWHQTIAVSGLTPSSGSIFLALGGSYSKYGFLIEVGMRQTQHLGSNSAHSGQCCNLFLSSFANFANALFFGSISFSSIFWVRAVLQFKHLKIYVMLLLSLFPLNSFYICSHFLSNYNRILSFPSLSIILL